MDNNNGCGGCLFATILILIVGSLLLKVPTVTVWTIIIVIIVWAYDVL